MKRSAFCIILSDDCPGSAASSFARPSASKGSRTGTVLLAMLGKFVSAARLSLAKASAGGPAGRSGRLAAGNEQSKADKKGAFQSGFPRCAPPAKGRKYHANLRASNRGVQGSYPGIGCAAVRAWSLDNLENQ